MFIVESLIIAQNRTVARIGVMSVDPITQEPSPVYENVAVSPEVAAWILSILAPTSSSARTEESAPAQETKAVSGAIAYIPEHGAVEESPAQRARKAVAAYSSPLSSLQAWSDEDGTPSL